METYNPDKYSGNRTEYQYEETNTTKYDDAYYYGGSHSAGDPGEFMNMNAGFETDGGIHMSGMKNLGRIVEQEVVAKSFLFMVVALIITAGAAFSTTPIVAIRLLTGSGFTFILLAELAIVLVSDWAISKNNAILAGILFVIYSYLTGVTFSILLLAYTGTSMVATFLVTAVMFGVMAVIGLIAKKDLTSAGSLLLMGLIGVIMASSVNLFLLKSDTADMVISIICVLLFVGLTAYDAQKIKALTAVSNEGNVLTLALMGAFQLYLDFINIFLRLLGLFGKRKN